MVKALSLTLQPDPALVTEARLAARRAFRDELGPDRLRALQLVLSELVTNAITHGQGEVTVRLQLDGDHVRGEVIDRGARFEHEVRERRPGEVGGHGLRFVEALVDRWASTRARRTSGSS